MKHDIQRRDAEPVPDEDGVFGVRGRDERYIAVPAIADANQAFVPEAPRDGVVYGRRGADGTWQRVEGGAVWIGPLPPANPVPGTLWWRNDPDGDLFIYYDDGVTEAWVQAAPGGGGAPSPSGFRGPWQVATNDPDLTAITPEDGWTWLAQTPDHRFAEQADATIPGIGGQTIWNGWIVEWVEAAQAYAAYDSSTLNLDDVNAIAANYVLKSGDVMTGGLTIDDNLFVAGHAANPTIPSNPEHLTNKEYVDGRITGLLTLVGVFNALTGQVTFSTASGVPNGPLPDAGPTNENWYVIVAAAGQPPIGPPETQIIQNVGDWWISDGAQWLYLPFGGVSAAARNVSLIPSVFGADNVQEALEEAEAQVAQNTTDLAGKVDKAGDVMTGSLTIRSNLAILALDSSVAPANNGLVGSVANINRWVLDLGDGAPEAGAASGSNFRLGAYSDVGVPLSTPLAIERATGIATFGNQVVLPLDPTDDSHAANKRYVDSVVGRVYIGSPPPPGAVPGTLWWRDDPDGDLYILYDDGSSTQWVSTTKPGAGGGGGGVTPPPLDNRTYAQRNGAWVDISRDLFEPIVRGVAYGREDEDWTPVVRLSGGSMNGFLTLVDSPVDPRHAVTKEYADGLANGSLYQGSWAVAANIPNIITAPHSHGFRYLCITANPATPETAPAALPGIGGQLIFNGSFIIWDAPLNRWDLLAPVTGGLTQEAADLRYLRLAGGTTTGKIITPATVDADAATTVATKGYVDGKVASGSDVSAWQTHTANGLWNTRSNINLRLINGGANIQIRALLDPNTRPLTVNGSVAFTLPGTHRPRWNGSITCAGPRQTQTPDNLDTIGNVSWFAATGEVRANAIWNTNNWVPPPQWLLLDVVIPRT